MFDKLVIKLWHGGKLDQKKKNYVGGSSECFEVEVDKLSYFELAGYVIELSSYQKSQDFQMYYLLPGKSLSNGLVKLNNDGDVLQMMNSVGEAVKDMLHLYVQDYEHNLSQVVLTGTSAITVVPTGTPTPSENDDFLEDEDGESVEDELVGSDSDTDDDEWKESAANIKKVTLEDENLKCELLNKVLCSSDEPINEVPLEDSEYKDSEGEIHSPGDSDDDDILGLKHRLNVPVVTESTDWTKWVWVPGTRFPNRKAVKEAIKLYAVSNGRDVTVKISSKKRQRLGFRCIPECPFRLYISFCEKKDCYMVKTVVNKHTCQRNMVKNRQLTSEFVADQFLELFKVKPQWSAKEIQDAVKEKFKMIVNPWFAYNAKRCAHKKLHGSMREHYSKMGSYLQALKEVNPTSTFELLMVPPQFFDNDSTSEIEVFFRVFVCFDGVKQGFLSGCRKLLCLDGCFLKTFLGGMLLAAIGRDANDQMFPVAWAVVEGENTLSWTWFMHELKKSLGVTDDGHGWTLISDQQKGLLNAVVTHWSRAEHRNCARHIYANWKKKNKGDELKGVFWQAVRSYCEPDFKSAVEEMKTLSSSAYDDFMKQNPKCLCRCYLNIESKADVVVNNMAETFNGYIIKSRSKHIIMMLEDIRLAIMTRLAKNRREMESKDLIVCPRVQQKLDKSKRIAWKCSVHPSSTTLFQVKAFDDVTVDLVNSKCSCRRWDLSGVPCYHVCAVAGFLGLNAEHFVHSYFKKDMYLKAYEFNIPPLPSEKFWPNVNQPLDPPPVKIQPGRPKKNRKKDPHEDPKNPGKLTRHGMKMSCGICGSRQHNRRKCPNREKEQQKAKGTTGGQSSTSQGKRKRGRPRKTLAKGDDAKTQQSQNASQGVVSLA